MTAPPVLAPVCSGLPSVMRSEPPSSFPPDEDAVNWHNSGEHLTSNPQAATDKKARASERVVSFRIAPLTAMSKTILPELINKYTVPILEEWFKQQLASAGMRADLIKEDELRG